MSSDAQFPHGNRIDFSNLNMNEIRHLAKYIAEMYVPGES